MGLFYKFWRLGINTLVNMQLEGTTEMNVNFHVLELKLTLLNVLWMVQDAKSSYHPLRHANSLELGILV